MKVILYMAITANGFIASTEHETPWSDEEFESYSEMVKECGNLIVGKTTYDLMAEENAFSDLGNPVVVCISSQKETVQNAKHFFVNDFEQALQILNKQNLDTALVGGGGYIDALALESGKVEEVFLDVEPLIFGEGIPLFRSTKTKVELELIGNKKIGKNGIQLHYKVIK